MKTTTIRIEDTLLKEAKINSINLGISLSQYIENLLKNDLHKKSTCS